MYSISVASQLLGVCVKTLRRWDAKGKIKCVRTLGGHRRFLVQEIRRVSEGGDGKDVTKKNDIIPNAKCAVYGRVSSHKQSKRGDLMRQVESLKKHACDEGRQIHGIYKDVASGLNTKRRGLWRMIEDAKRGKFSHVFISYKDRLTRFGFRYIKKYFSEFGVSVSILNDTEEKSPESEMVEDMIAIIHSFSGRMYRMRRSSQKD